MNPILEKPPKLKILAKPKWRKRKTWKEYSFKVSISNATNEKDRSSKRECIRFVCSVRGTLILFDASLFLLLWCQLFSSQIRVSVSEPLSRFFTKYPHC
ncbi:hypothetical protein VNO77_43890 [Canavalia gladiata]|uniref:Uncharacterized protein n=1 Tax=Canavalia gladiata TaxID=3824 RepID=A0AAN9PPV6_CANGL